MPLLLAFDTATKLCAVALSDGDRVIASREEASERLTHAEHLNVFIQQVMEEAGRSLNDLTAVAVGIGPGSYTGLRIGLSAAKGLCFALDVPIIGMSTLDVLCAQLRSSAVALHDDDLLHPMIDARRMEVFTRTCDHAGNAITAAAPLVLDEGWCAALASAHQHVVFGDGADKAASLWTDKPHIVFVEGVRPSVNGLASCANACFDRSDFADLAYLVPDYGKEANVTQAKKVG